jgi:hypothetical protein
MPSEGGKGFRFAIYEGKKVIDEVTFYANTLAEARRHCHNWTKRIYPGHTRIRPIKLKQIVRDI